MRFRGVRQAHFATHYRTQRAILQPGAQRSMNAGELAGGSIEERHRANIRVALHQLARGDLHIAAAADHDHSAMLCEHRQILAEVHVGQHLQDDVHSSTPGELEDLFEITGVAMIDDVMRTLLSNQLAPRICSASADHRQPSRPRHLRRGDANAARQTIAYIPRLVALARDGDGH